MTGEKNRHKSLEKLWKLDDEQLKTPKHDEMVLNLLTKDSLFRNIPFIEKWWNAIELAYLSDVEYDKEALTILKKELESMNFLRSEDSWECKEEISEIKYRHKYSFKPSLKITSEYPVFSGPNKFLIGYWDVVVDLADWISSKQRPTSNLFGRVLSIMGPNIKKVFREDKIPNEVFIEVKPKVTSFGATLRQIRTYQSYCGADETNTILYTNDVQFNEAFEGQGIIIVNPPKTQSKLDV